MSNPKNTFRSTLYLGLYLSVLLVVFLSYLKSYPIPDLARKISALICAGYLFLACSSLGHVAFKAYLFLFRRPVLDGVEHDWFFLYEFCFGTGLFGFIVFVLGWVFPFSLHLKLTALNLFSVICLLISLRDFLKSEKKIKVPFVAGSFSSMLFFSLAVPGLFVCLISAFSPITYYDSLVYHLALPAIYNQQGFISAIPYNLYSFFPANFEMIFLFIMNQFKEADYIINLFGWGISFLTSWGIYLWAKEIAGDLAANVSFFLWWTIPSVLFLSVGGYIDLPLAFFVFIAIRLFYKSKENNWDESHLYLSALVGGFAASIKYTGVICPFILGIYFVFSSFLSKGKFLRKVITFSICAFLPFFLWLVKNYLAIQNPFFPFFGSFFKANGGWGPVVSAGYFQALTEYGSKSHVLYDLFIAPFQIAQSSMQFGGGFDVLGDFGWGVTLLFMPLGFFFTEKRKRLYFLGYYVIVNFLIWSLTKPVLRFLIPMLPVSVLLSSIGIYSLCSHSRVIKIFARILLMSWVVSGFFVFFEVVDVIKPFKVSLGLASETEYLSSMLPYYSVFDFANQTLNAKDKILLIGEQRTYHLKIPFFSTNFFAPSQLAYLKKGAEFPASWLQQIMDLGYTHILLNEAEVNRLGGAEHLGISVENYRQFFEHLKEKRPFFFRKNIYLFYLKEKKPL